MDQDFVAVGFHFYFMYQYFRTMTVITIIRQNATLVHTHAQKLDAFALFFIRILSGVIMELECWIFGLLSTELQLKLLRRYSDQFVYIPSIM